MSGVGQLILSVILKYYCLHYHGPYSPNCYVCKSIGEWKHSVGQKWRRHLRRRNPYNDKFYGNDCVLGRADFRLRDQHEGCEEGQVSGVGQLRRLVVRITANDRVACPE